MQAMRLHQAGMPAKLITFGAFRIGDFDFADFSDTKITDAIRITYEKDFAVLFPTRAMGYRHSKTEIYQTIDGGSRQCADQQEDPTCNYQFEWQIYNREVENHGRYMNDDWARSA